MDAELTACENVIKAFLYSSVTEQRKSAEHTIGQALRDPNTAVIFVDLLKFSNDWGVRQCCGVLLRKKANSWISRLTVTQTRKLKERLLESLQREPNRLVRLSVAHAISALGKSQLRGKKWPELLPCLQSMAEGAEDPTSREVALLVFYALCDVIIGEYGTSSLVDQVAIPALQFNNPSVCLAGLRVVQALIPELEERGEVSSIARLLPFILTVLERLSSLDDACEACVGVLEVLDSVLTLPIKKHRDIILRTATCLLSLIRASTIHPLVRDQAALCITTLLESKPKFVANSGDFLRDLIQACAALMCEEESVCEPQVYDTEDFDDEAENTTPCDIGARLLDAVCGCIPPDAALGYITEAVGKLQRSNRSLDRKGSLLISAVASREYADQLRPHTERLMSAAAKAGAEGGFIQEAALVAMAFYGEYLQPDSLRYHASIIPLLLNTLREDTFSKVRQKVCLTLGNFCENLGKDLEPYVAEVVQAMLFVLMKTQANVSVQHAAMSTITSVLESGFARPFFGEIIPVLRLALSFTQDEQMVIRAAAVEAFGVLGSSLGPQEFDPLFADVFQQVMIGMQYDFAQLREQSYGFFANMASIYGRKFTPFVDQCLPHVLRTIQSEDGTVRNVHPFASNSGLNIENNGVQEDDSSSEDSGIDDEDLRMRVHQTVVDEKAAAIFSIAAFAEHLGENFFPYVTRCVEALNDVKFYFDHNVRKNVVIAMANLVIVVHMSSPVERVVGYPRCETLPLPTREAINMYNLEMLNLFKTDESPEVIASVCDGLKLVCGVIGAVGVHQHMEPLMEQIGLFLRREGFCQTQTGRDEEEEEGMLEKDAALLDAVADLIEALAKAYGPGFYPFFQPLLPAIMEYCAHAAPPEATITAICVLAEVTTALKEALTPHTAELAELAMSILTHPQKAHLGVLRNAVVLFQRLVDALQPYAYFDAAISALMDLLACPDLLVVDNVVSTLLTMLRVSEPREVPLPVLEGVLRKIPLQADFDENSNVYMSLCWLLAKYPNSEAAHHALPIVCTALSINTVQEQVKNDIANRLQSIDTAVMDRVQLSPDVREVVGRYIFRKGK